MIDEHVKLKGPANECLIFRRDTSKNQFQTDKLGRSVFDTIVTVEVITPGSKESSPVLELLREFDEESGLPPRYKKDIIARYQQAFDAYMSGTSSKALTGTPIEQWPSATISLVAMCKEGGIFTVEALACLPDEKLRVLGPGSRELRERAKVWVDQTLGGAPNEALAAENERLRADLARVTEQMGALDARVSELLVKMPQDEAPPAKSGKKEV